MNYNDYICPNYTLVECIINPSTGNTTYKNPFPQVKELQNRKVVAIETYSAQDFTFSPISSSNPVIPQSVFQTAFLTLYRASTPEIRNGGRLVFPAQQEGNYYDQIPLSSLRRVANMDQTSGNVTSAASQLFRTKPAEMTWTKSYVTATPPVAISSPVSSLFGVHYLNENEDWQPYM